MKQIALLIIAGALASINNCHTFQCSAPLPQAVSYLAIGSFSNCCMEYLGIIKYKYNYKLQIFYFTSKPRDNACTSYQIHKGKLHYAQPCPMLKGHPGRGLLA